MDHIVYVDAKASELEKLLDGTKTTIIRGAAGRKMPYGRVNPGDVLYLINNNAEGLIRAKAKVKNVFNSEKMTKEDSVQLVSDNQEKLQLTPHQKKRWAGKRYLVLIEVSEVSEIEPFSIDKSGYGNMDDWLPVENIRQVKIKQYE
jgi:hypothetical protein